GQFAVGYAAAVGMLRQGDKPIVTPETLAAWLGESDDAPAPPPPPVNITREVLDAWLGIASGAEQSTPHPAGEG
ncbi:MAG: hypothetical protein GTN49_03155, partial [candidate division Zixibacteria bacterium]|nr:hypothetical protein [candidate division Zixibacteria bacterium]